VSPLIPETGFRATFCRELRRIARSRLLLLSLFALPPLAFAFIAWFFSEGVLRDLPVAVLDQDHSALSREIIRRMDATPGIRIHLVVPDFPEGQEAIQRGEVYGLLLIPKDLEKEARRGLAPVTSLYVNNTYMIAASLIMKDATLAMQSLSAGLELKRHMAEGQTRKAAMARIQPIRVDMRAPFNPYTNYFYFLAATLLPTLLHMFVITSIIYAFGSELAHSTAGQWLERAGGSALVAMLAKLLPYTLIFWVWGLFMNAFLFRMGVPMEGSALFLRISAASMILAYQAIGIFLVALCANLRMALSLASFYASTAFAFVGITFPAMGMPSAARIWGDLLPLTHYLRLFVDQTLRGAPVQVSLDAFGSLWLFILLAGGAGFALMPRTLKNPECWGRS
jgi:ABC-2 type transport system permease protein